MAPRSSKKGKAKVNDDTEPEPPQDHPYIVWMRQQQAEGFEHGRIRREACIPPSSAPGPSRVAAPAPSVGNVNFGSEDESSASPSDSDTDLEVEKDDDEGDGGVAPSGSKKRGAQKSSKKAGQKVRKRTPWTMEEMAALAAARWYTREDIKQMQGKQGAQFWKKLRQHMRKAYPNWIRRSEAMKQCWKRLEAEYEDICEAIQMSGAGNMARPDWFTFMDDLKHGTAAVNPHVVDGGGAGMRTADPTMTIPRVGDLPATQDPNGPATGHNPSQAPRGTNTTHGGNATPRKRAHETATIQGASMISSTMRQCNASGVAKIDELIRIIVAALGAQVAANQAASQFMNNYAPAPGPGHQQAPSTMNDTTGHPSGGRAAEEAVAAEEDCEDGLDVTNEYLNEDDE
ncbi:unnamed protein product [Closterium sp. NIES-64]|nr:unnamed protein product [Closterium sp. NIES-64]CAI5991697.1 unnamed protein product [Closterium sp. NIES-65]